STAARAKVVTYSMTRMVARRMRRRFFGANRPTNAAMTTSAAPRMRMVDGDAYPSHCCARWLGAGKPNGSCESICCETITAPAPAAAAAAWRRARTAAPRRSPAAQRRRIRWRLRQGNYGGTSSSFYRRCASLARFGLPQAARRKRQASEVVDVVQLADLQVVAAERGD